MNFDLSLEQKMLAAEARKLFAEAAPPTRLRRLVDDGAYWDATLWRAAAQLGLLGAAIAEIHGGTGLTEIDVCVICEETGRGPAPIPFMSSIGMAAEAIRLAGSQRQQLDWLPRIAAGDVVGTYAWQEGAGQFRADRMSATVDQGRLTGRKCPVPDARIAHFAVVAAMEGGAPALYLVDTAQQAVAVQPMEGFDQLRRHGVLCFDHAKAERLPRSSPDFIAALEHRAAIYTAFEQIGGAEACLFMARDYVMQRKTFGRPVGSYQAVKHRLADILMELELARSNAYYAAWALATGAPDLREAACVARLSATSAYDIAARENLHLHGGLGYTWEANCHFHYRRARLLAAFLGGPDIWAARLAGHMRRRADHPLEPCQ